MSVMKTTRDVRGIGLSIPRADGAEKVTGRVEYVADIKRRGLLYAKLLRSPHAHARIVRIDSSFDVVQTEPVLTRRLDFGVLKRT